jgi:hypothetical protein
MADWSLRQLVNAVGLQSAFDVRFMPCISARDTLAGVSPAEHPELEFTTHMSSSSCGQYAPGDAPKTSAMTFSPSAMWWMLAYKSFPAFKIVDLARTLLLSASAHRAGLVAEKASQARSASNLMSELGQQPLNVSPTAPGMNWLEIYRLERSTRSGAICNESASAYDTRHGIVQASSRWMLSVKQRVRAKVLDNSIVDGWSSPDSVSDLSSSISPSSVSSSESVDLAPHIDVPAIDLFTNDLVVPPARRDPRHSRAIMDVHHV